MTENEMIPVTTFADKKVAVFGLGGSGLLTARALKAGGAHVIAWDDAPLKNEQAKAAGIETANLADIDWSDVAALVLSPGVPLTHPTPHWTVQRAKFENVEVIGDIELFCRERAKHGPACPLVAITGTNGKSTTTALTAHLIKQAGRDAQMGGNIGTPALALEPFAPGRHYVLEVSSYQVDLAPSLKPTVGILINVSADHLDRHGTIENYAAIKTLVVAQVEQGGTAVIGVDDRWSREAADRVERAGRKVERISVEGPVRDGYFADGPRIMRASAGKPFPASARCAVSTMRRTPLAPSPPASRLGSTCRRSRKASSRSPASRTACRRSAARRQPRVTFSMSTTPRRPMPTAPRRRCRASRTFSGSPAASRRRAASRVFRNIGRASARPI
jgi:UDP-N-acetylmuramoylalanine--D-glutamate ligase